MKPVVRLMTKPRIAHGISRCSGPSGSPFAIPSIRRSKTETTPISSARPMKCSVSHSGQIHGTPPATAHPSRVLCNHVENACTTDMISRS